MIKINDLAFDIHETMFIADICLIDSVWQVKWSLVFEAEYEDLIDKNGKITEWKPSIFNTEAFPHNLTFQNLANNIYKFKDKNSDGEPLFKLRLFGYSPIRDISLQFGEWIGDAIEVDFAGIADINYDETYNKDVKIHIRTLLQFDYVKISTTDEIQAKHLLTQFFPIATFKKRWFDGKSFLFDFIKI